MIKKTKLRGVARWLATNCPHSGLRMWLYKLSGIKIDKDAYISYNVIFVDGHTKHTIRIGKRVAIAPGAIIIADSHANYSCLSKLGKSAPVIIEDDAWIGANAVILPGVKIGYQSIIGAGAVITKDVEPLSVVVGVPGRVIKRINSAVIAQR